MSEEIVEDIGVEHGLGSKLLAELVAPDDLVTNLVRREVEVDLGRIPRQLATFAVLFHFPAVRREGVGIAVDDVANDLDLTRAAYDREYLGEHVAHRELLHICRCPAISLESEVELGCLSRRHYERVTHDMFSFWVIQHVSMRKLVAG